MVLSPLQSHRSGRHRLRPHEAADPMKMPRSLIRSPRLRSILRPTRSSRGIAAMCNGGSTRSAACNLISVTICADAPAHRNLRPTAADPRVGRRDQIFDADPQNMDCQILPRLSADRPRSPVAGSAPRATVGCLAEGLLDVAWPSLDKQRQVDSGGRSCRKPTNYFHRC